eukprot:TRINITY_DN28509_c0_g1_i1.p2 TRINITY_DN28509_c0_g1~~TRINITY_DN28509_c0_g1_i1.p2  ORF type:complete len:176 (+),score=39.61 TRINITY_DN28509_c0_g1_i1:48-575(+)
MGNDCCTSKNIDTARGRSPSSAVTRNMEDAPSDLFSMVAGPAVLGELDGTNSQLREMIHQGHQFKKMTKVGIKQNVFVWVDKTNTRMYWVSKTVGVLDPRRGFDGSLDLRRVQMIQPGGRSSKSKKLGFSILSGTTQYYFECEDNQVRDNWVQGLKLACQDCHSHAGQLSALATV